MKLFVATILFVAIAPALNAQTLDGGFRIGPTAFMEVNRGMARIPFEYQQGAITPELFVRYQGKSHWVFEASLAAPTRLYYEERVTAIGASWQHGLQITKSHQYELGLAAQYELSCRHAKKTAKQSRFHYYMGISATAVLVNDRSEVYEEGYPESSVMSIVANDFQLWGGSNHTLTYELTKHWTVLATGDTRFNLNRLTGVGYSYGGSYPAASIGFRLGAAYRIWEKKDLARSSKPVLPDSR